MEVGLHLVAEIRRHFGHSNSAVVSVQVIKAIALELHFGKVCKTWANQGTTIKKVNASIPLHLPPASPARSSDELLNDSRLEPVPVRPQRCTRPHFGKGWQNVRQSGVEGFKNKCHNHILQECMAQVMDLTHGRDVDRQEPLAELTALSKHLAAEINHSTCTGSAVIMGWGSVFPNAFTTLLVLLTFPRFSSFRGTHFFKGKSNKKNAIRSTINTDLSARYSRQIQNSVIKMHLSQGVYCIPTYTRTTPLHRG